MCTDLSWAPNDTDPWENFLLLVTLTIQPLYVRTLAVVGTLAFYLCFAVYGVVQTHTHVLTFQEPTVSIVYMIAPCPAPKIGPPSTKL